MREGVITKHDLDRIINAVEHEMKIKPIEKPKVVIKDLESESDESHIVNLDKLTCTCKDYEYNCNENQYCKHIYNIVFKKHKMI